MHVYEPLSGLHRPIVIDTGLANFQDLRLAIYCPPGDLLNPSEAASLCRNVGTLFENQGASVTTAILDYRLLAEDPVEGTDDPAPTTDLILELRARELHQSNNPVSWLLCLWTFTLVPAVSESTFAQEVVIRDGSGALISSDTLQGRIVRRFGVGTWGVNKVLDLGWREPEDELTGDAAKRDLSQDLYQQLSQLVFNAKMRWEVSQRGTVVPGGGRP